MRQHKSIYVDFAFYDRAGIERFLEKQAAKGWLLESTGSLSWRFVRVEPGSLHFSVTFFRESISSDEEPSEQFIEYLEYCARTGWRLIDTFGFAQIFYTEQDDPIPIETDSLLELETIHDTVKEKHLYYLIPLTIVSALRFLLNLWSLFAFTHTKQQLIDDFFQCISSVLYMSCFFTDVVRYFLWKKKAEKEARVYGTYTDMKCLPYMNTVLVALFALSILLWVDFTGTKMELIWVCVSCIALLSLLFIPIQLRVKKKNKAMQKLKSRLYTN